MSDNDFLKKEIREFTIPEDSYLKDIIIKISTFPDTVGKEVLEMIARISFAAGHAQLAVDMYEMNINTMDSIREDANDFINTMWVKCDEIVSTGIANVINYNPDEKPSFT
jgi:hypothetical protein